MPKLPKQWPSWAPHALAAALIAMALLQQWLWLQSATAIETWDDDAGLFRLATCFEDQLRGSGSACSAGAPYPPLIPAIAAAHFFISGIRGLDIALLSLWPWTIVLGWAAWIGVRRASGSWAGLAAVALSPVVVWSLHIRGKFYTEVPLAALGLAAVVAWVHSEHFTKRWPSLLLGLTLGAGLLTKWSFAFFLGPAMAWAWALGLSRGVRHPGLSRLMGAAVLGTVGLLASGTSGRLMGGLAPGLVLGAAVALCAGFLISKRPEQLEPDTPSRWVNLGLSTVTVLLIAGPWYMSHLGELQAFLTDNIAQKFHGDAVSTLDGLAFYPAVLLTRVLGSPLSALLLLGVGLSARRTHPALSRWTLLALLCGVAILGVLPYRSGRYLVAGLGLVVPAMVIGAASLPRIGQSASILLLVCGIAHQLSWIPLGAGWLQVPHHWPIFTLPEQDLFGNSQAGIDQAQADLTRPRWRFLPVASPPVERAVAARELVQATAEAASGPFLLVIFDPASRVNANSLKTEILSSRPSPLSAAIRGDVQPSRASLNHWTHQARHPPDSPATASGNASRWLYIGTAAPSDDPQQLSRVEDLVHLLSSQGWTPVLKLQIPDPFEPTTIQVWGEPQ